MDRISSFFLYFDICNYICLDTSYDFLALSLLLNLYLLNLYLLYLFKYSCTNILHKRSPCTFYDKQLQITHNTCNNTKLQFD